MATLTGGNVRMAIRSLKRNKMRSFLTMLGVIIGVMSVVLVMGIGNGIQRQVRVQSENIGQDLITIRPGQSLIQQSGSSFSANTTLTDLQLQASGSLSAKDVSVISQMPQVSGVAPLSLVSGGVSSSQRTGTFPMLVIGTNQQLPHMLHQGMAYGGFFTDDAVSADKVVIGSAVARALFDERVPLGQTVLILGHQFIITGIFSDFQSTPFSPDANFNNAVFIPYDSARAITNDNSPLYEILARPVRTDQTDAVVSAIQRRLADSRGGSKDFSVLKQSQTLAATNQILRFLTLLIIGMAAIALLVGGVGIMNIMLVSITERMHEIGLRKALGATTRQITAQFMTEAAVLSAVGGVIGVILAFGAEGLIWLFTSFTPDITWKVSVIACGVSIGIGILFGSVPAIRAAQKEPIAALRNE